jgi:molecular chaperone HscB
VRPDVAIMIDFSRNHFELFGLPTRYRIDGAALERAYRALQSDVHPDRHAGGGDAEKRVALQASAHVNDAYRTLQDAVTRAEYLLRLLGVDATAETDSRLPVPFLTEQLERREAAEEAAAAHDEQALDALVRTVRRDAGELQAQVERLLDASEVEAARMVVREMRFLTKLADDLDAMHAVELDR